MKARATSPLHAAEVGENLAEGATKRLLAVQGALLVLATHTDGETDVFDVLRIAQFIDQAKGVDD